MQAGQHHSHCWLPSACLTSDKTQQSQYSQEAADGSLLSELFLDPGCHCIIRQSSLYKSCCKACAEGFLASCPVLKLVCPASFSSLRLTAAGCTVDLARPTLLQSTRWWLQMVFQTCQLSEAANTLLPRLHTCLRPIHPVQVAGCTMFSD